MQAYPVALRRLDELYAMVMELGPIRFGASDRAQELSRAVPLAYGAVEDVYRQMAGDRQIEVTNGTHTSVHRNFFEAGWLSGRTFHHHEGLRELERVIGRVRATIEDGAKESTSADPIESAWPLIHPRVRDVSRARFDAGHYADAVEAALKELSSTIRDLVVQRGGPELDGVALMQRAFSVDNPFIVLADLGTQSGRDMHRGYKDIFAGAMSAIRNPKAHENLILKPERAMHLLFLASMLWSTLDQRP